MSVLALVPARSGSKGCPGKNLRKLGGQSLLCRATTCAQAVADMVIVSTDIIGACDEVGDLSHVYICARPPELAQDDTSMVDVVKHVLGLQFTDRWGNSAHVYGDSPDDIWLIVQPTQPFRQPKHLRAAIELLEQTGADSVVSVVEAPSPDKLCRIVDGRLVIPSTERRQDAKPAYKRDGTVYAFRRRTVDTYQNIYGQDVRPLIIPAEESCELDTEQDWQDVERRWRERNGVR